MLSANTENRQQPKAGEDNGGDDADCLHGQLAREPVTDHDGRDISEHHPERRPADN